jgi:hypothetical protein
LTPRHAGQLLLSGLLLAILTGAPGFSQNQSDVSVSFDHVSRATAARKNIDSDLLWLRIRNNTRTPIQVLATAPQGDADGVEVVHEIVLTSGSANQAPGWISPPEHYSPINEATTVKIQPKGALLFSAPLNHVGPSWRLRITYQITGRKARAAGQTEGTVDFTWADVPIKERESWRN